MDRVRLKLIELPAHHAAGQDGEPDFRIGRTGNGAELIRADHQEFMPSLDQLGAHSIERADDAIDLRIPGIRHDCYAHQEATGSALFED
jgi:hypothetical protein